MKRYYRNRFILGAMLSFLILLVLAVAGIWLFSYRQMDRETSDFLQAMQRFEEGPAFSQPALPPLFGGGPEERGYPSAFYILILDPEEKIQSVQRFGIPEDAEIDEALYARQALQSSSSTGRIGSFKYSVTRREDGTARLILLDISLQLSLFHQVLKSALLVGGLMTLALFLILLPISSRVAAAFVRSAEQQKQFITDAGHDLKTPVAIIRSNLDVMDLLQGKNKWSQNIRSQAERLERMIGQLLMMSRLDETSEGQGRGPVDLARVLREENQHYLPLTSQRQIQWHDALPDSLPAQGDEKTLRQMVTLLLDNAAQYTSDEGRITLSGRVEKKRAVLEILNTVDKLPAQKPEDLAERFVRGDTARTQKTGGTGIGLSAVKRIVEMHRGALSVSYPDDHTFSVTVSLPSAQLPAP